MEPFRQVIKLFVGQIPKTLEEEGVRDVFKEFGEIAEIVILRDRRSGMHQGCCFVKYATLSSAQVAIQVLHNQRALPPLRNPLQVRFADSGGNIPDRGQTNRDAENKLFVGGVPVGCGDKELRLLFSNYGEVQDVYILASKSSQEGQRGCAFVRYAAPQSCAVAIEALHGKYAMKAGELPLVVRFADPPKSQRGLYGSATFSWTGSPSLWAGTTGPPPGWPITWGPGASPGYTPWVMPPGMQAYGIQGYGGGKPPLLPADEQQRAPSTQPPPQQPPLPTSLPFATASNAWSEHKTPGGFKYYYQLATGISSWDPPADVQIALVAQPSVPTGMAGQLASSMSAISIMGDVQKMPSTHVSQQPRFSATSVAPSSSTSLHGYPKNLANGSCTSGGLINENVHDSIANGYAAASLLGGNGVGGLGRFSSGISEMNGLTIQSNSGSALPGLSALAGNGTQFYDAAGANVVLVHDLPDQFTSQELLTAFAQFGKVVFCDLGDDHSGRVDYGSSRDANKAVATMNGLPVGEKKLNVRLVGLS